MGGGIVEPKAKLLKGAKLGFKWRQLAFKYFFLHTPFLAHANPGTQALSPHSDFA